MAKKAKFVGFNFNPDFKLHKACTDDDLRPAMAYVYFKNGYAYATNAHIAVRAKIEDISNIDPRDIEALNGKALHYKQFELLLKHDSMEVEGNDIKMLNIGDNLTTTITLRDDIVFPNVDKVLENAEAGFRENPPTIDPCINIALLNKLCAALGNSNKKAGLRFCGLGKGILVKFAENEYWDVIGLLMPTHGNPFEDFK